jgi:hypothetical protein
MDWFDLAGFAFAFAVTSYPISMMSGREVIDSVSSVAVEDVNALCIACMLILEL